MPHRVPREPEEALQMRKDKRSIWQYAIPLTLQPLSPLGRGEPQSNLISIFSQLPPSKGSSPILSLPLLVLWVNANDPDNPLAMDDFAFIADFLY
jgi:hypothetical protein